MVESLVEQWWSKRKQTELIVGEALKQLNPRRCTTETCRIVDEAPNVWEKNPVLKWVLPLASQLVQKTNPLLLLHQPRHGGRKRFC